MKFSIIIPAHNSAPFIQHCLSSIKAQTFNDYEIIVICDDCTDNTAEIAETYGALVIKTAVKNDGLARNKGLDSACGDHIIFLDSDDWWINENTLQIISNNIGDHDILAFGFHWKGIGDQGPRCPDGRLYPHVWNKCWRRAFIGNTHFPNVYPDSDRVFHNIMMNKLPELKEIDDVLYYYNFLRGDTISDTLGRKIETTKKYWGIE